MLIHFVVRKDENTDVEPILISHQENTIPWLTSSNQGHEIKERDIQYPMVTFVFDTFTCYMKSYSKLLLYLLNFHIITNTNLI